MGPQPRSHVAPCNQPLLRWAAMTLSRFGKGKDGKTPYERQKGRKCDLEVVPFGEIVQYRLPEIAVDKPQALEPRWAKGVWLGHARHSSEVLIGTEKGVVKAWAIKRMVEGQQEDGDMVRNIKGSPTNWKLDASEDRQLVEVEDRNDPALNPDLENPVGRRTGEKRSLYLSRRDFELHG